MAAVLAAFATRLRINVDPGSVSLILPPAVEYLISNHIKTHLSNKIKSFNDFRRDIYHRRRILRFKDSGQELLLDGVEEFELLDYLTVY